MAHSWSGNSYRHDIDGLRAIAVLSVILFHINPHWLPGGFVGVDVFFVISGYLITGMVTKELAEGTFTFRRFYERRIRRILPALWVLLIVCVPVSWLVMLPDDAVPMGKSAIWSTLAMANVYFWREVSTDYFAPQSAQLPFLHLWSLGVEEQFYVLWPVALLLIWRIAHARAQGVAFAVSLAIVLTSVFVAEWLLAKDETRLAYYMLPSRAGELALGGAFALARWPFADQASSSKIAHVAAAIGSALLVYCLLELSEQDPFPGWRSLLPTVGAALLILSGQMAPANDWLIPLRCAPALWLGRCSYSAYLWHWPILAWWRYLWGQPNIVCSLALLVVILLVAHLSQRFVENPVRLSPSNWPRTLVLYGIAPAMLVTMMGLLAVRGDQWGVPLYTYLERKAWAELKTYRQPAHHTDWICQQHVLDFTSLTDPKCEVGYGTVPARVLLLGDSHAAQFAPMFRLAAEVQGLRIRSVALGACAPLAGSLQGVVAREAVEVCEQGVRQMLERAQDFPLIILGAAWGHYARNSPDVWVRLESQLREFVAQGHQVWLLPKVPDFANFDAACPEKRVRVGDWLQCPTTLIPRISDSDTNTHLAQIAQRIPGVRFLPLHETLCANGAPCPVVDAQGHNLYSDSSHLSTHGAHYLAAELQLANRLPNLSETVSP
jgi:peptidoglycan/LPS O-acetylase OafA/YrhL